MWVGIWARIGPSDSEVLRIWINSGLLSSEFFWRTSVLAYFITCKYWLSRCSCSFGNKVKPSYETRSTTAIRNHKTEKVRLNWFSLLEAHSSEIAHWSAENPSIYSVCLAKFTHLNRICHEKKFWQTKKMFSMYVLWKCIVLRFDIRFIKCTLRTRK